MSPGAAVAWGILPCPLQPWTDPLERRIRQDFTDGPLYTGMKFTLVFVKCFEILGSGLGNAIEM